MKIKYNRLHQQEGSRGGEYSLKIISQYFNHDIDDENAECFIVLLWRLLKKLPFQIGWVGFIKT